MSNNKIIKELHETTLISFKDCRAILKKCKWNFRAAYIKLCCDDCELPSYACKKCSYHIIEKPKRNNEQKRTCFIYSRVDG